MEWRDGFLKDWFSLFVIRYSKIGFLLIPFPDSRACREIFFATKAWKHGMVYLQLKSLG